MTFRLITCTELKEIETFARKHVTSWQCESFRHDFHICLPCTVANSVCRISGLTATRPLGSSSTLRTLIVSPVERISSSFARIFLLSFPAKMICLAFKPPRIYPTTVIRFRRGCIFRCTLDTFREMCGIMFSRCANRTSLYRDNTGTKGRHLQFFIWLDFILLGLSFASLKMK